MVTTTNLISYYKCDTNGTFPDAHGSSNGVINGASFTASGKINGGYDFDGDNDDIVAAGFNDTVETFSFWFNRGTTITSSTPGEILLGSGNVNYYIGVGSLAGLATNETLMIVSYTGSTARHSYITSNIAAGWHHVCYCWNSGQSRYDLYLDGSLQTLTAGTNGHAEKLVLNELVIGSFVESSNYYDGIIDEIGLWDAPISSGDVADLYNNGDGLAYPFGVVGLNMSLNISDTWKDVSGMKINIGDTWKEVVAVKVNIGDDWKDV